MISYDGVCPYFLITAGGISSIVSGTNVVVSNSFKTKTTPLEFEEIESKIIVGSANNFGMLFI